MMRCDSAADSIVWMEEDKTKDNITFYFLCIRRAPIFSGCVFDLRDMGAFFIACNLKCTENSFMRTDIVLNSCC